MAELSFSTIKLSWPTFIVVQCFIIVALLLSLSGAYLVPEPLSTHSSSNAGFPSFLPHSNRQQECPVVLKPQSPSSRFWTNHRNKPPISHPSITTSSKTLSSTFISNSQFAVNKSKISRSFTTPRIINGREANEELARSLVFLVGDSRCTGTLVSSRVVFTAAHCQITGGFTAIVGGMRYGNGQRINVLEVLTAGDYFDDPEGSTWKYDFSVVILESDARTPARPMKVNVNPDVPEAGSFARVAGYGDTEEGQEESNSILYQVDVPITTNSDCNRAYSDNGEENPIDGDRQVCAGYDRGGCDSCQGDSGGPLIQYDPEGEPVLVAVVSYGRGCAREGFPGVYVRVVPYEDNFDDFGVEKSTDAVAVYGSSVSIGAIVGGVIVAIIVALVVVGAVITVIKRKKENDTPAAAPGTTPSGGVSPPPPPGAVSPPPPSLYPLAPPPAASYMPNVLPSQGGLGAGGSPREENAGLSLGMPYATTNGRSSLEPYTGLNTNPTLPPSVSYIPTTPQQGSPPNPLHANASPNNTNLPLPSSSIPQTSLQVPSYSANWGAPPGPTSGTAQ